VGARTSSGVPAPAPHELRRDRLLELLHRHGGRPLILLVAPAGFGKSTLAAAYARDSGAAVAWVTLLAGDRDSRAFFGRVAAALENAFDDGESRWTERSEGSGESRWTERSEGSGESRWTERSEGSGESRWTERSEGSGHVLTELRAGLAAGAESVGLARLLERDLAQAPAGFILVLDDFHVVQDADEVLQAVDVLVRGLPPEIGQIVITAREPPPLSMTRLVASDSVFALGTEDLRFTEDEVRALRRALGGDASNDAQAEGWVAGILLGGAPRQLGAGGGSLLGGYVEREVVGRLRPSEQRWLETLSVLEVITPAAAARLLGAGPWFARLAALSDRCPFLAARADGSYRLHSLIRETFLNRLRRAHPGRAARAWTIARKLAEEAYDTAGVVRACQELGRLEDAVAIVRSAAEEARQSGRWSAVLASLELLPENVRRNDPGLSLLEAQALRQTGRPQPARLAAEAALRYGGRLGDVRVQISSTLELAAIARHEGDMAAADDWLSATDYLISNSDLEPHQRRLLEGGSLGLHGVCAAVRGQTEQSLEFFESAERLLALNGPSRELALVQHNLGKQCVQVGDLARAQAALAAAAAHWRLIGDRTALALTQGILGALYLRMGDLDRAGTTLLSVIDEARAVGATRVEAHAVRALGDWHRANGRLEDAVEQLDNSIRLAEDVGERELLVTALQFRAEVAILQDDLATARRLLARGQAESQILGGDIEQAGIERALGRLYLAEGAGQRAVSHLEAALQRGGSALGPVDRLVLYYWLGTAHLSMGRPALAETALNEVVELARQAGGAPVLAKPAAEDPSLLRFGLRMGIEPLLLGDAERIAARRQPWTGVHKPPTLQLVAVNDMPRVEARLFGPFTLHCDGELAIAGPRGHLDRARELLALLILHPTGISDRDIVDLLWPDMGPQRALHNLRMTAYLLRRLLGSKATVRYAGASYQLAPQLELWADVREFDAALGRARRSTGEAARAELNAAVALYRGPLLAEAGWPWVDAYRLDYQTRLVEAALQLADLEARTDPSRSDALAEQVLAVEPDNEAAYERLLANAQARRNGPGYHRVVHRYQRAAARYGFKPRLAR
jgi:LuxR family transcriptional regulator, maltose regulon positive regulatory protein